MPEAEDLLREARQALRAAEVLLAEGLGGDSVTRSYHAMLYAARGLLATKGLHPRTHSGVLHALGLHYVAPGLIPRDLVASFGAALEARQRADYGSLTAFLREHATAILDRARAFVDHLGQMIEEAAH